jgi:hypothetical protein
MCWRSSGRLSPNGSAKWGWLMPWKQATSARQALRTGFHPQAAIASLGYTPERRRRETLSTPQLGRSRHFGAASPNGPDLTGATVVACAGLRLLRVCLTGCELSLKERALTAPFRLRQCASGSDIYCAPERLSLCVATHSGRDKGWVGGVIHRAASWCPHES